MLFACNKVRFLKPKNKGQPALCMFIYKSNQLAYILLCDRMQENKTIHFISVVREGSGISGKEVHMYKGVGVRFADFISFFFLNIP